MQRGSTPQVPSTGLIACSSLRMMWMAVGAEVVGIVSVWSEWAEAVDVVDVGGQSHAVGFAADGMGFEVAASGASPLGVVSALGAAASCLVCCPVVGVAASTVGECWAAWLAAHALTCHACLALPCLTKPCPAGPDRTLPCHVNV